MVAVEAASITATVEAIDYDKRTIARKGPRGNVLVTKVGPDVKNFKQIKTGDNTVNYYDATAIYVRKPHELPSAEEAAAVQVAAGTSQEQPQSYGDLALGIARVNARSACGQYCAYKASM